MGTFYFKGSLEEQEAAARKLREEAWKIEEARIKRNEICLACEHCFADSGEPHWSELTPGRGITLECFKGHWNFFECGGGAEALKEYFDRARSCMDFEKKEECDYV